MGFMTLLLPSIFYFLKVRGYNKIKEIMIMRVIVSCIFMCVLATFMFDDGYSQILYPQEGDKVRLTYRDENHNIHRISGKYSGMTDGKLFIVRADSVSQFEPSMVQKMEVSTGAKKRTGRGAIIGAATGGIILGAIVGASGGSSGNSDSEWFDDMELYSSGEGFLGGFFVGALLGSGVGAIVGSNLRTDKWQRVALDVQPEVSIRKDGSFGLRFAIRF